MLALLPYLPDPRYGCGQGFNPDAADVVAHLAELPADPAVGTVENHVKRALQRELCWLQQLGA